MSDSSLEILKKFVGWAAFSIGILSVAATYATLSSGLSTSDRVSGNATLSSISWNRIVDSIIQLDERTEPISSSWGFVGIGTANPQATLHVNGSVRIGGKHIQRITRCGWSSNGGIASPNGGSYFHYGWKNQDCDYGLPTGNCTAFLTKWVHAWSDQDWEVLLPWETNYNGSSFTNGGMSWWTSSPSSTVRIGAVYFCDA